jgi:hypothetical protein
MQFGLDIGARWQRVTIHIEERAKGGCFPTLTIICMSFNSFIYTSNVQSCTRHHTVNKLRSINLLFSSMFRIGRTVKLFL